MDKVLGTAWNYRHEILDVAGMVPVIGEAFDVANAALYLSEGDYVNAGMSMASTLPAFGNVVASGKMAKKGVGLASGLGKNVDNIAKKTDDVVEACLNGCFTEGTQIVVGMEQIEDEHGNLTTVYTTANIEDIQVGDLVYSYDTLTGETELCEVNRLRI